MKIEIKHIPNTFNYGSCMMAISLIDKLNKELKDLEIYIDAKEIIHVERLQKETNMKKIFYNVDYDKLQKKNHINGKGITIILGGDDISEYYGFRGLDNILNFMNEKSKYNKVFLIGQTIGPFTGERIDKAKMCLNNTKIYTRDDNCFNYLKNLDIKNVAKGTDLAFTDLPIQDKANHILQKYNLEKDKYITLVLSGLGDKYTPNTQDYTTELTNIITNILKDERLNNKKIVLLPHVTQRGDDRITIKEVMKKMDNKNIDKILPIYDEMLPSEAREILGNGIFTITGRMHAAVSSLYMKKPAIALSYSVKYKGVIGEGLDLNDLIIESSDENLWKNKIMSNLVSEKIDYILDNYNEIVDRIDLGVSKASKLLEEEFNNIIKEIKKFEVK